MIYWLWFLDVLGLKPVASKGFAKHAKPGHHPYVVYMAAKEPIRSGRRPEAKELLEKALEKGLPLDAGGCLSMYTSKTRSTRARLT